MATAKVMIILLVLTVALTTSTVFFSTLTRPTETAAVVAGLLRLTTAVSWITMAILWVGNRIISKIDEARTEALMQIARLANRLGDEVLAAELEARLGRAEEGSSSSIEWIHKRRNS